MFTVDVKQQYNNTTTEDSFSFGYLETELYTNKEKIIFYVNWSWNIGNGQLCTIVFSRSSTDVSMKTLSLLGNSETNFGNFRKLTLETKLNATDAFFSVLNEP